MVEVMEVSGQGELDGRLDKSGVHKVAFTMFADVTSFHCCIYALPKPNSHFWDIHKRQTPNNARADRVVPADLLLGTHPSS